MGKALVCSWEGELLGPLSYGLLRVEILGEASEEDLNRIAIRFPGVSFQGCGL